MGRPLFFLPQLFFIHGIIDQAAAIVLLVYPQVFQRIGTFPDPAGSSNVALLYPSVLAAGLMGIGTMSLIKSFNRRLRPFRSGLEAKIAWAFFMVMVHVIYVVREIHDGFTPGWPVWVILAIFGAGFFLWTTYRLALVRWFESDRRRSRKR